MLVGQGANAFAKEMGIPEVLPDKLVTQESRDEFEELIKFKNTIQKRFSFSTEPYSKGYDNLCPSKSYMYFLLM